MTKKWLAFLALIPTASLIFLDQTILPVALPTIQQELEASSTALQWSVNAYFLTIAIFVLISGKIGDRISHRKALFYGMMGFSFFSVLCALSLNIEMLIISRGLQGIGAALMLPAQTAIISQIFPQEQRGRVIGTIVGISSLFLILGPLIGGFLTETLSWRWIFWINLPIALFGLWMIRTFLPSSDPQVKKIDSLGFLFFACGVGALTTLFMQAAIWGWTSIESLLCIAIIPISFGFLLWREKQIPHPFLDLTLFKKPIYAAINISITTTNFIMMISVFRTIYLQEILDYTPLQTGLITCISAAPVCFMAPVAGKLSDRFGPKLPVALGFLCLIFSFFFLGFFSTPSFTGLIIAFLSFGMGIPMIFTPSFASAVSAVPPSKTGIAMGMIFTLRMLANTIGLALIHLFVTTMQQSLTPSKGARLAEIISFSRVHFVLGFLTIIVFAITFVLHNRKSSHEPPSSLGAGWD